ncbi:helix-turn-helix domain-containing protein [Parasedimentitalea maritima]|uniref:Helix-turn-helix domain-containing protein n=1 Tax=Parasedimentitalea maritima TaxID=2578117 RepID=A0A6A4R696_9RHOB|nr:XRE family transcriptional regulator [Zongyanglinia marina]KAE9624222.1 helix-turn-helix domain-containing protein [Zongyanglinia marina]
MKIGHAIRRIRHAQGRTLQQLCDAAGNGIQTGYLSRIERDELAPSVYVAAAIAKALGTTLDSLIAESEGRVEAGGMPSASRLLVPILPWESAHQFVEERDYTNLPTPEGWVTPPMESHLGYFALRLRDDSMQALDGLSWSRGGIIIVDLSRDPEPDDYVVVADQGGKGAPLFRQMTSDGRDLFLRPRNPQYPMRQVDDNWAALGVVIGQVIDLTQEG